MYAIRSYYEFCHRMLGYLVLAWALVAAARLARLGHPQIRGRGVWLAGGVLAQVVIGIVTVMHGRNNFV